MVMVRCTGTCVGLRVAACALATARSIEVVVASRWAADMNASASWGLSVFSAWRRRAAMRASILSSDTWDPASFSADGHGVTLGNQYDFSAGVARLQIA